MDKYQLLIILNLPFVIFGVFSALVRYKESSMSRLSLLLRLIFWSSIAFGIFFAKNLYNFLVGNRLTDSPPLSLADVVLVTGVSFCFFLCIRLYSRLDATEQRLTELQERLSIILSEKGKK